MSSCREQIVAAALTALNTSRPVDVDPFVRTRDFALGTGNWGHDLYPMGPEGEEYSIPVYRQSLVLRVELNGRPSGATTADQAIDPAYVWALKVLRGNKFGGLAHKTVRIPVKDAFRYETTKELGRVCVNTLDFEVTYTTSATDPTATL